MSKTNRDLQVFGWTLGQIKTWAVLVLGRDEQADQGGGVSRQYTLDEAFKIFLCGLVVSRYHMGLKDAQRHINFIWPWLIEKKLLPSAIKHGEIIIPNELTIYAGSLYRLRIITEAQFVEIKNDPITSPGRERSESFTEWWFSPGEITLAEAGASYTISISRAVESFLEVVGP
jgi:hypothetical protein